MAQNITLLGASYSAVPAVELPKTGGGTASFTDVTDTTATAADVAQGKYFYTAAGVKTEGTASGGGGAAISVVDTTDSHGGTIREITAVDLSDTTATASDVASGKYFYTAAGVKTEGTYTPTTVNIQSNKTVSPSTSSQTVTPDVGYDALAQVTVNAMPSGTAGTPTATKGAVSNHSVTVTPSVTNTTGYITGSTKTGTAVTVSASELVSGSETKTANGTYDVTNLAELVVNVSGTSKNTQIVQGTTRTTSSTLTAIGAELTVSKTGKYDIYWSAFRSSTSASYTYGTQLYIGGTAHGTENTTWSNHVQNNHLTNVSLTANQKIRVYGRNSRGSSYYIYAPMLAIVEV